MIGPCDRLITFITPQIKVSPMAASPYTKPRRMPSGSDVSNRLICCMLISCNKVGAGAKYPAPASGICRYTILEPVLGRADQHLLHPRARSPYGRVRLHRLSATGRQPSDVQPEVHGLQAKYRI